MHFPRTTNTADFPPLRPHQVILSRRRRTHALPPHHQHRRLSTTPPASRHPEPQARDPCTFSRTTNTADFPPRRPHHVILSRRRRTHALLPHHQHRRLSTTPPASRHPEPKAKDPCTSPAPPTPPTFHHAARITSSRAAGEGPMHFLPHHQHRRLSTTPPASRHPEPKAKDPCTFSRTTNTADFPPLRPHHVIPSRRRGTPIIATNVPNSTYPPLVRCCNMWSIRASCCCLTVSNFVRCSGVSIW